MLHNAYKQTVSGPGYWSIFSVTRSLDCENRHVGRREFTSFFISWTASYILSLLWFATGSAPSRSPSSSPVLRSITPRIEPSQSQCGMGYGSLAVGSSLTPARSRTCSLYCLSRVLVKALITCSARTFRIHQDWLHIKGAKVNKSLEDNKNAK